jgi:hypothetical protein
MVVRQPTVTQPKLLEVVKVMRGKSYKEEVGGGSKN